MDYEFWNKCWQRPSQPFHVDGEHPFLKWCYADIFSAEQKILIPLSGKSLDAIALAERKFHTVSIEFNPLAVHQFFNDNNLSPLITSFDSDANPNDSKFLYQVEHIDIWLADFFNVNSNDTGLLSQVWDRAALVALPDEMRKKYISHLKTLLKPKAIILTALMDYDDSEMSGPPFKITEQELKSLYHDAQVELLDSIDIRASHPRWEELKLSYLHENLYRIQLP